MKKPRKTKAALENTQLEGVTLDSRNTLGALLEAKKLYDVKGIAEITGLCERYVRQLCRTPGKVAHHKLLGRYYMTPAEVAALLTPVPKCEGTTTD